MSAANLQSKTVQGIAFKNGLSVPNVAANSAVNNTNPVLSVVPTALGVTGLTVTSATAGNGVVLSTTSTQTDEGIIINPKGDGPVIVANDTEEAFLVQPAADSAIPSFQVDCDVAGCGIQIDPQTPGNGVVITTQSTADDEPLVLSTAGAGPVRVANPTANAFEVKQANNSAVGAFRVSTDSAGSGLVVAGGTTAGVVAVSVADTNPAANTGVSLNALNTGAITLQPTATGQIVACTAIRAPPDAIGDAANAQKIMQFGTNQASFGLYTSTQAPGGAVSAFTGSICVVLGGGVYINTTAGAGGATGTTWAAISTA